jgi:hypothetical protein
MKSDKPRSSIGKPLLILWAALSMFAFVWIPGRVTFVQWANMADWPFLAEKLHYINAAQYLLHLILAFLGVSIFSLACLSMGSGVLYKTRVDHSFESNNRLSGLAFAATGFLIGHGIFSVIFLTLGALYKLSPLIVVVVLAAGFLTGIGTLRKSLGEAQKSLRAWFREMPSGRWEKTVVWLSITILLLCILYSTAMISYDATAIYFSDAKLTALSQRIEFFTDNVFVASVFHTAIQYTAISQLFGDQSARMFSWVSGLVFLLFCAALGERASLSRRALLLLPAFVLTSTAFIDLTGDGKVDLISSAPAIAAIYWMLVDAQNRNSSKALLLLTGFFIGLAVIARPYNAVLLGVFVLLFYAQQLFIKKESRFNFRSVIGAVLLIGLGAIGLGLFHLYANWILLNNPLDFLTSRAGINPTAGPWNYDPGQMLLIRLLYPFVATYYNSPETLGNITPLLIAFLPALFIYEIRHRLQLTRSMWILLVSAAGTLLIWIFLVFTVYEFRYVLFLWAILFMPVAEIAAAGMETKDPLFQKILQFLFVALLAFMSVRTLYISLDKYSPVDSSGNPQCNCKFLGMVNDEAPPGARVLSLSAYRYYLRTDLFACSTRHDEYNSLKIAAEQGAEAFWQEVRRQGYTYLLYDEDYDLKHLQMGIVPGPENTPNWIHLTQLYMDSTDLHRTYRIDFETPPTPSERTCKLDRQSGIWEIRTANQ